MTHYNGPQDPTQWGGQPPQGGPYPPVPPGPAPKKNWFARHKILTGLFGLVALIVVVSIATSAGSSGNSSDAAGQPVTSPAATSAAAAPNAAVKDTPAARQTKTKAAEKTTSKPAPAKDTAPHIGTPVRSGDLQFTVTKVVRDQTSVGEDFMAEKAQGRYTLVYVTVRNVGDDSETFFDDDQKIKDADSKTYSPDSAAELAMKNNDVWLSDINPGNAVDGVLVYDMPVGVKATAIDFSGGLFDDAKTVQLH
ncbi:DUF4352 domain-containing protein [Flexivirga oryzae]|uniref:DUF4352 domain-containing protein n=1 Tax=Flexivirga oryzae TaxID=1794944 RepID=A0A839NCZ2_9MICO|nr:DUF4352 domain-containing protein [Flexivirga oryzae]MBB2894193.1 hypothetical protein [Flexivirga oryzae]